MKQIGCVAIDDEPLALQLVEGFIHRVPYLNAIGVFESTFDSIPVLKEEGVQLLFLDINMPDLSGIDFLKSLKNPPLVIFTTAYDEYALQGFELDALDYLLKPFSYERFLKAANKAYDQINLMVQNVQSEKTGEDYIFVKSEHNIIKIPLNDILYIQGFKDYLKVHTHEPRPIFTLKSMKSMEEMLPSNQFIRVHRSYIISIDKIHSFRNGRIKIMDKAIPIGELYRESFHQKVVEGRI